MAIADQLVEAFTPWMTPDLETYLTVIGEMFSEYEEFASEQPDGTPGWVVFFDPDRCPVKALPYLAQLVGERLPVGISEAAARQWIKDAPNQVRATIRAMCLAGQRRLTGSKTIMYRLRSLSDGTPDADHIQMATFASETPDVAGTRADILSVSPADIEVDYVAQTGPTWAQIKLAYATWADVKAAFATWDLVKGAAVGWTVFTP